MSTPRDPLPSLEVLLADAAHMPRETVLGLRNFIRDLGPIIDQASQLCELISRGFQIVLSIDLCELMDTAFSSEADWGSSGGTSVGESRRVHADVHFSRQALSFLRSGRLNFSVLPGAAAEILQILRSSYADDSRFLRSLAKHSVDLMNPHGWRGAAIEPHKYKFLERVLSSALRDESADNRLVGLLGDLFVKPNYVKLTELQGTFADVTSDLINTFERPLGQLRKGRISNNFFDAWNLACVSAANVQATTSKCVVVHMTRTSTLHKLGEKSTVHATLQMNQEIGELSIPLLCHPRVLVFMETMFSNSTNSGTWFEEMEGFGRAWAEFSSFTKIYLHRLARDGVDGARSSLSRVMSLNWGGRELTALSDYMRVFSGQVTSDVSADWRQDAMGGNLPSLERQARALDRFGRVRATYELVRDSSGLSALANRVDQRQHPRRSSAARPLSEIEHLGLRLRTRRPTTRFPFWDVRVESSRGNDERGVFIVGLQYSARTPAVTNCYWEGRGGVRQFLMLVHVLLKGDYDAAEEVDFFVSGFGGTLDARTETLGALRLPDLVLSRFSFRPIRIIQVLVGSYVFSYEAVVSGRRPYTSLRYEGQRPSFLVDYFLKTGGLLPRAYIQGILEEADASGRQRDNSDA